MSPLTGISCLTQPGEGQVGWGSCPTPMIRAPLYVTLSPAQLLRGRVSQHGTVPMPQRQRPAVQTRAHARSRSREGTTLGCPFLLPRLQPPVPLLISACPPERTPRSDLALHLRGPRLPWAVRREQKVGSGCPLSSGVTCCTFVLLFPHYRPKRKLVRGRDRRPNPPVRQRLLPRAVCSGWGTRWRPGPLGPRGRCVCPAGTPGRKQENMSYRREWGTVTRGGSRGRGPRASLSRAGGGDAGP